MITNQWISLLLLTLTIILVAGGVGRRKQPGMLKYGLIWLAIIAIVALLYDVLAPRFTHPATPAPLPETESKGTDL